MHRKLLWLLGLAVSSFTFCAYAQDAKTVVLNATSIEEDYFHARDKYIDQFAKMLASKQQNADIGTDIGRALTDLEQQLRTIIGPTQVKGFPGQGHINLETLVEELGFNMVDGLKYTNQSETAPTEVRSDALFVTTKALLNNYLQRNPEYPKDLRQLAETGKFGSRVNFYSEVFDSDASVTTYLELPIKLANGQTFARAFLGIFSQDIGPSYVPTQIFVIASRDNKVFVASVLSKTTIGQITECQKRSDELWKQSEDIQVAYIKSKLKNKELIKRREELEEQSFWGYQRCFEREAKQQTFFNPLITEVQSIVDSL